MKAFLIDPETCRITEVDYNGDFHQIYTHLQCDTFDCVRVARDVDIWVDDEGLLKDPDLFFKHIDYPTPLAGRGLVLSHDDEGNSTAAVVSLEELKQQVVFFRKLENGMFEMRFPEEGE